MNQQQSSRSRTAAPGEVIFSEGYVGTSALYVIADGKVEISTQCDEKRVILATLGKGEIFGESALLPSEPRGSTAKALTFCRLTVIETSVVEEEMERVSPLLRHLVRTMIRRTRRKDELLATYTHADFLPGVLSYAHVLALMAGADTQSRARRAPGEEVSVPLAEVIRKCRAIAGHSRLHVMAMLKRMEKLNLVSFDAGRPEYIGKGGVASEDGAAGRHMVSFDPIRLIERAQQVADHELDLAITGELELIELSDLEALIGVEKQLILKKLSHSEIAEDIFAFRKSKVLNYVEEHGTAYFSKRKIRTPSQLESLGDLEFVDQRTLFDAVSAFDTYDLAKLLATMTDQTIADRLLSVMTQARQNEISWIMRRDIKIDPLEIPDIEQRFIELVKSIKSPSVNPSVPIGSPI
ncbi:MULTISPECIES: Crp/Fnr family transcriptional regulator [Paraburkholderia]|uniref:cAMP-binding domain of CRP or a regulatory subunit of cAMP-dependent protein kinases n=1 Tax=Paraburkholderia phenazinium TaxID=60549 RepID=A0A1N6GIZ9_9BURK|nr:cyclic nucleotide-binding domain-containing protein [Paraburkholderia phenazinium]SIO07484.1 cAMP-binding domain of CRP or a regulatory subunit of cAMP-dependent protein kinases [Paraburkholderia phenazinium]